MNNLQNLPQIPYITLYYLQACCSSPNLTVNSCACLAKPVDLLVGNQSSQFLSQHILPGEKLSEFRAVVRNQNKNVTGIWEELNIYDFLNFGGTKFVKCNIYLYLTYLYNYVSNTTMYVCMYMYQYHSTIFTEFNLVKLFSENPARYLLETKFCNFITSTRNR